MLQQWFGIPGQLPAALAHWALLILAAAPLAGYADTDPARLMRADKLLTFTQAHDGWIATGINVKPGEDITLFGDGNINMGLPAPLSPNAYLWYRVGADGRAQNPATDTFTFRAKQSGELYIGLRPIGLYWHDQRGTFPADYAGVPDYPLQASVRVVVWRSQAEQALADLATRDDNAAYHRALHHLTTAPQLPDGFSYLWNLGRGEVFAAFAEAGRSGIRTLPRKAAGIVKKPLDIPLTEDTRISFDWLYHNLPAQGPEDEAQFHDYMSIALEFDNGQDITWLWSKHLAAGHTFTCPLPWWDQRETHIVLQQGEEQLGSWHSHSRPVAADYRRAVGGGLPTRIVGVWFINAGLFGGPGGEAVFTNAVITGDGHQHHVFSPPAVATTGGRH